MLAESYMALELFTKYAKKFSGTDFVSPGLTRRPLVRAGRETLFFGEARGRAQFEADVEDVGAKKHLRPTVRISPSGPCSKIRSVGPEPMGGVDPPASHTVKQMAQAPDTPEKADA